MGLKTAIDIALTGSADVLLWFRGFWSVLPLMVQALIIFSFGMMVLFGLLKMLF
jgi:hypothetical protein